MKLVILVLASHGKNYESFDKACRETWVKDAREMGIQVIFYYGGSQSKFVDDNLFLNADDSYENLSEKLMLALEFLEKSEIEYDCIYRTNHSSQLNIKGLLNCCQQIYHADLYAGYTAQFDQINYNYIPILPRFTWGRKLIHILLSDRIIEFASGSGFFLSKSNVKRLLNSNIDLSIVDDVMVGKYMNKQNIYPSKIGRVDFVHSKPDIRTSEITPTLSDIFHFRHKSENRDDDVKRMYELHKSNFDISDFS